jgi:hypothetical protein
MIQHLLAASISCLCMLPAQQLAEGYRSSPHGLPDGAGNVLRLSDGATAWFTGTELVLAENGATRSLLQLPGFVFGSFTIEAGADVLLFGESSAGDLWLVPVRGGGSPRVLANLTLNYDAARWGAHHVLVSAKTGGFGSAHNDVVAVDLRTGALTALIRVPGASGPLVVGPAGELYYATAGLGFPPPPGGVSVLRWDAQTLRAALGNVVLTELDAHTVYAGIDAASDLALDGDADLFFVDWWNGTIGELSDVRGASPRRSVLLDHAGAPVSGAGLQFVGPAARPGRPDFEPFQPAGGGRLLVHESAFGGPSQLRTVEAARPRTTHTGGPVVPRGPFALVTDGGPALGLGFVAIGARAAPFEIGLPIPGFEQTLFWNPGLLIPSSVRAVIFDASGQAVLHLHNPGIARFDAVAQVAFADAAVDVVGSAAAHRFRLGR